MWEHRLCKGKWQTGRLYDTWRDNTFFLATWLVDLIFPTRDWTHTPALGTWSPNCWTARKVHQGAISFIHTLHILESFQNKEKDKCLSRELGKAYLTGFPGSSDSKESAYHARRPGLGRSPGEGIDNPLQYSCLENPMDRGTWWAIAHAVTKSQTQLSNWTHIHTHTRCHAINPKASSGYVYAEEIDVWFHTWWAYLHLKRLRMFQHSSNR